VKRSEKWQRVRNGFALHGIGAIGRVVRSHNKNKNKLSKGEIKIVEASEESHNNVTEDTGSLRCKDLPPFRADLPF
jgi:hypothetical protein